MLFHFSYCIKAKQMINMRESTQFITSHYLADETKFNSQITLT